MATHPELVDLLVALGFKPIKQAAMLKTVGKVTSIKAGAKMINVPLDDIVKMLKMNGYIVIGED